MDKNGAHCVHCFSLQKRIRARVVKQDYEQRQGVKNMNCPECSHEKGKFECLCCCSVSQIGYIYCILPVLCYRQIKKMFRNKTQTSKIKVKKIATHKEK